MSNKKDTKKNLVFKNRKAFHDFTILDTLEAGIMLEGSEVKAIREGRINLKDSFVRIIKGEVFILKFVVRFLFFPVFVLIRLGRLCFPLSGLRGR